MVAYAAQTCNRCAKAITNKSRQILTSDRLASTVLVMSKNLSPGMEHAYAVLDLRADQTRGGNARAIAKQADQLATSVNRDSEVDFTVDYFI